MNSKNINNNEIDSLYPVWMEVDLEQLRKNYELISLRVGSSVGIISIVKCNAYGHGLVSIARCLERLGSDKLGVGSVEEALTLRNAKIKKPVVILYPSQKQHFFDIIENDDIEVSIDNYRDLLRLDDNARKKKKIIKIHVHINTGLNQYGVKSNKALSFIKKVSKLKNLSLEGIWTHYSDAEGDKLLTKRQFEIFMDILKKVSEEGIEVASVHTANSFAIDKLTESYDIECLKKIMPNTRLFVRPGCFLYGTYQSNEMDTKSIIRSIKTKIVSIIDVEKGGFIGYFQRFKAVKKTKIATLPVGWGNTGYNPNTNEDVFVLYKKKYARRVGITSSNTTTVDIGKVSEFDVHSDVYLVRRGDKLLNIDRISNQHGMFTNQFISALGSKVPKIYIS